jgi:3-hydroxybutyryl-CoA dehydrogenase
VSPVPTHVSIERLGVIGAGQMGRGIAQLAALKGMGVTLVDAGRDLADKGRSVIAKQLGHLVEKQKLTAEERDAAMARISPADIYGGDLESVDFVVEAATENFDLKQEIFSALDQACRPGVILATNTSSISITAIGSAVTRPDRVIGMHFMNPPPLMKLVEIIRGLPTSDITYETTRTLAERLGKTTVVSRDIPGFVVNRILMPMLNEACFALFEGIACEKDIDVAIQLGLNHPMGPCALMDLIGLDTTLAILEVLHRELGDPKYRPCPLLRQYVAAGWLGRKAGRGFYHYPPVTPGAPSAAPATPRPPVEGSR